ncbi:glycosyltransferase [Pararhodobacter marinus]|uniref:glycosyltransferase n=1 Tax=Pararhodobacter marinus TaxID=2184063 RepID=UPI0035164036
MTAPSFVSPESRAARLVVVGEQAVRAAEVVICIPARDEEALLPRCLAALAPQLSPLRAAIVLIVNNSRDATARVALAKAREWRLPLILWEGRIEAGGVGAARRLGGRLVRDRAPRCRFLLSTDADAVPAPGWIAAMAGALRWADAATGLVQPIPAELAAMPQAFHSQSALHARYLQLTEEFLSLVAPRGGQGLNLASGANFGIRFDAYEGVGGYAPLASHEDRDLLARLRTGGWRLAHARDAVVQVSMRAEGRAPDGMSSGIAQRLAGLPATDSALRPLSTLLRQPFEQTRGADPVPTSDFVASDIAALAQWVERLSRCPTDQAREHLLWREYCATHRRPGAAS